MKFTKMHGIGNDYIYINNFIEKIDVDTFQEEIRKMSDRYKGIGGDGVIFICPSAVADVQMRMFNADASEANMCGNGIRCVGKYAFENGLTKNNPLTVETKAGIKTLDLEIIDGKVVNVTVDMGVPILNPKLIPVNLKQEEILNYPVKVNNKEYYINCVSMGNPHCVIFTNDIDDIDLEKIGPLFENNLLFPERTNTEFVEIIGESTVKMRVWERGTGETLACGTGASAVVVAGVLNGYFEKGNEVKVILKGGELFITYTLDNHIMMKGSATTVYSGEIY